MRSPHHASSSFDFKQFVLKPVIPTLLVMLLATSLLTTVLQNSMQEGWQDMTDLVSVEIHHTTYGTTDTYDTNAFPVVNKGDILIVRVDLPEERMVPNAVLGFNIPHVAGYARYGDEVLWSYGEGLYAEGKYVGNLFFRVPLRDEMWGGSIELVLNVTENRAFSSIPNVQAMPAANSVRYFFSQFQMDMFLFIAFFVLFILAFFVFLFYWRKGTLRLEGLFLSAFCVLLGAWFLAGHGFFYALSDNVPVCAHLEYIAFYLMPIPFCLFMCVQVKNDKIGRLFCEILGAFFIVMFLGVTVANYTTAQWHFTTFLVPLQACMVIGVAGSAILLIRHQYSENLSSKVIRYGVALSMLFLMLEVGRYNVGKYLLVDSGLNDLTFASTGMLVFAGALTVGYIARLTDAVGEQSDKALLRRLAYVDVLTGISNRTYCLQKIQEMENINEQNYALVFFDLNALKWANDQFGHDMGDLFLQVVADTLKEIYGQQQFCGRWGGDEFLVCLTGASTRHAEEMLRSFDRKIQTINDSGQFPFYVSVAYGMVRSTAKHPLPISEAIKEADRRMYSTKIRMHENLDATIIARN